MDIAVNMDIMLQGRKATAQVSRQHRHPPNHQKDIPDPEPFDEKKYQLKLLKQKALEAQRILDEKNSSSQAEGK